MRKYAPAIAILALMGIVCMVALIAPYMASTADRIALALLTVGCASIPVLVLWKVGMDVVNPALQDFDDDEPYSSV